ncbi:hypothetical protein H4582DRAFT_1039500 [Lactarius indigo]|nr:hypothetical protein H4582DRAFT_1039500 [Lactarius indigo]
MMTSAPTVRREPTRGVPSIAPPPRAAQSLMPASRKATPSVEPSGPLQESVWRHRTRRRGRRRQRLGREDIPQCPRYPGVCVRDAPLAAHQVAAARLAHPSRVRLASAASAHSAAGDDILRFQAGCRPAPAADFGMHMPDGLWNFPTTSGIFCLSPTPFCYGYVSSLIGTCLPLLVSSVSAFQPFWRLSKFLFRKNVVKLYKNALVLALVCTRTTIQFFLSFPSCASNSLSLFLSKANFVSSLFVVVFIFYYPRLRALACRLNR